MFAVIYRATIKSGKEEEYQRHWRTVAGYFIEKRGALGSCLHKASDGTWVAYSQWPDKQTRDANWGDEAEEQNSSFPENIVEAIARLKDSIQEEHTPIEMEIVDNLLSMKRLD